LVSRRGWGLGKGDLLSPGGGGEDVGVGWGQTGQVMVVLEGLATAVLKLLRAREVMRMMVLKYMVNTEQVVNTTIFLFFSEV
jgi:hypothetical protein